MNLTKEEAISKHRALWNKIAELLENGYEMDSICVDDIKLKLRAIEELEGELIKVRCNCYCCEYVNQNNLYCQHCPVIWGNNDNLKCYSDDAEYDKFLLALESDNYEEAIFLAKEIAKLPEREDDDTDDNRVKRKRNTEK